MGRAPQAVKSSVISDGAVPDRANEVEVHPLAHIDGF